MMRPLVSNLLLIFSLLVFATLALCPTIGSAAKAASPTLAKDGQNPQQVEQNTLEKFPELKTWAEEIEKKHSARDESVVLEMINEEPDGEKESRKVELKRLTRPGAKKSASRIGLQSLLIRILEPKNLKGTAVLVTSQKDGSTQKWIYVPSTKQVRRIVSSDESSTKLLGSEVASTDFDMDLYRGANVTQIGKEDGKIRIETQLKPPSTYTKCVGLFHESSKLLDRSDCWDKTNVKVKSVEVVGYQKLKNGIERPRELKISNLKTGRTTRLLFENYKVNSGLSASQFTPEALSNN